MTPAAGVDLWWIPLGAGGWFVEFNGRLYERVKARQEHRHPVKLYHCALEVHLDGERFIIENAWPIPSSSKDSRGVVLEGPVFSDRLSVLRLFRYEVRRWRDGTIFDQAWARHPVRLSDSPEIARRLLDLVPQVPPYVWGRKVPGTNEMWNSNSVVSWLLTQAGYDASHIERPVGGRAPGWDAGCQLASHSMRA